MLELKDICEFSESKNRDVFDVFFPKTQGVDIVIYLDNLLLIFDFSSAPKKSSDFNFSAICRTRLFITYFNHTLLKMGGSEENM